MKVSAVVVSHGHAHELERSLPALAPQVDELVVIANLPGSVGAASCGRAGAREPAAAHVRREREPRRRGDHRRVRARLQSGRGARAGRGRRRSSRFADEHPRAGLVGPLVLLAGRHLAAVAAPLPDRAGHDLAPNAAPARCAVRTSTRPRTTARARPSRCRATGCSAAPAC